MNPLQTPLSQLRGVGKYTAAKFARDNFHYVADLLLLRPKKLLYCPLRMVSECESKQEVAIRVTVRKVTRTKKTVIVECNDDSGGQVNVVAMSTRSWVAQVSEGSVWVVQGAISTTPRPTMICPTWSKSHCDYQLLYPGVAGLSQARVRAFVAQAVEMVKYVKDPVIEALCSIHRCSDPDMLESLITQVGLSESRAYQEEMRRLTSGVAVQIPQYSRSDFQRCIARFGYSLTKDQSCAIDEILQDLCDCQPMSRLLQGDVGSGKTIVALVATAAVTRAGRVAVIMSPTVVLAQQHYSSACKILDCPVFLLTGKSKQRRAALEHCGACVIVGTHALIHAELPDTLALAVIDEQHKFGVQQRLRLRQGGVHVLSISATPIPRSLQLASLGYLSTSTLREKPLGRMPIATYLKPERSIEDVYTWVQRVLDAGLLVYWVCPRIIDDPKIEMANIEQRQQVLEGLFPGQVGIMHGRSADKESILADFRAGKFQILLSTTVIEVGIDIHEVKGIVIEQAEQYGLAQLHQLRGRVGRGKIPGNCILIYRDGASWPALRKLRVMQQHQDGFEIARRDREMRGHGDVLGNLQTGVVSTFKYFDPLTMSDEVGVGTEPSEVERMLWRRDGSVVYSA